MTRRASFVSLAAGALVLATAAPAWASYSAPLTRVLIDRDRATHTPSFFYASDLKTGARIKSDLDTWGLQYVAQLEWANGWGLQLGAAAAYMDADFWTDTRPVGRAHGWLAGGQVRGYKMVWSADSGNEHPHALTAFTNLRVVTYDGTGQKRLMVGDAERIDVSSLSISAGLGAMLEISLASWISVCPYAWISPSFKQDTRYNSAVDGPVEDRATLSLRQPLRTGFDVWIYPFTASESHISLSAIASLIDTEGKGNKELSFVLSYTF
ncbi:hypothetical protein L6R52_33810 [Myxococcota bacterium]|nr:hypothetical protein [Myxococcota bacterium]